LGAVLLPPDCYETERAETLLVVEHVEELVRNRCRVVLVGAPARLVDLLAAAGVRVLPSIRPSSPTELKAFLGLARTRRPPGVSRRTATSSSAVTRTTRSS